MSREVRIIFVICLAIWILCSVAIKLLEWYEWHLKKKQRRLKNEMCNKAQSICNKECRQCAWYWRGEE